MKKTFLIIIPSVLTVCVITATVLLNTVWASYGYTSMRAEGFADNTAWWAYPKDEDMSKAVNKTILEDKSVEWDVRGQKKKPLTTFLEMDGQAVSARISYGVDKFGRLRVYRYILFPPFAIDDYKFLSCGYELNYKITVNGRKTNEKFTSNNVRGMLTLASGDKDKGVRIIRVLYPSYDKSAFYEEITVVNTSKREKNIKIENLANQYVSELDGKYGVYKINSGLARGDFDSAELSENMEIRLGSGESYKATMVYAASMYSANGNHNANVDYESVSGNITAEYNGRKAFVDEMFEAVTVVTPYKEMDAMFSHAMLRQNECIYRTKAGYMQSPAGGGGFYNAMWTNDQCEYFAPFAAYSGYELAYSASVNCFRMFGERMDMREIPFAERKALQTSINGEGDSGWWYAGDRGDGAMYAYGALKFVLSGGDIDLARELYPYINWALDFSLARKNAAGVIKSDSDELEGRFPSGEANLSTSCLVLDALHYGAILAGELDDSTRAVYYQAEYTALRKNIIDYFSSEVEGYKTYRYYDGSNVLRSWICMPLNAGIYDRAEATLNALFSERMLKYNSIKTISTDNTIWDRAALFTFKGGYKSDLSNLTTPYFLAYTRERVIGNHGPYPYEAYPEGKRSQLSTESTLYCRVFTEGILGLNETGLGRYSFTPALSPDMSFITVGSITLNGQRYTVEAALNGSTVSLKIFLGNVIILNETKPKGSTFYFI